MGLCSFATKRRARGRLAVKTTVEGSTPVHDKYVAIGIALALALLAQGFRIAISRINLHNSLRVYRQKALAEGFCGSYDRILNTSFRQTTQHWWKKVDSTLPGKAYRDAIGVMAHRRVVESLR